MIREIAQYRYYGSSNPDNNITLNQLTGADENSPLNNKNILQLGIQAPSGVRFWLNGDTENSGIVINSTNIYELNVDGMTIITSVNFDRNTINTATKLIIDIVYEAEEGTY